MATPQRIDAASGGSPLPGFFYGESFWRPGAMFCRSTCCLTPQTAKRKLSAELSKSPVDYFSAGLVDDSNVFEWDVTIIGPSDTILCVTSRYSMKYLLMFQLLYPHAVQQ